MDLKTSANGPKKTRHIYVCPLTAYTFVLYSGCVWYKHPAGAFGAVREVKHPAGSFAAVREGFLTQCPLAELRASPERPEGFKPDRSSQFSAGTLACN